VTNKRAKTKAEWGRLLLATDFSPGAERAYRCVVAIAQNCHSELYAVHAIPPPALPYLGEENLRRAVQTAKEEADRRFAAWDCREELGPITHHFRIVEGRPADEIARLVNEEKIDVAVVSTHGYLSAEKFPLGSVAEKVFRTAEFPVLTVGGGNGAEGQKKCEIRRILYASNLTPYSDYAARFAFSLAEATQAQMVMMHVIETTEEFETRNEELLRGFFMNRLRRAIPKEMKLEGEPELVAGFGAPEAEILRVARERETDLIVMGVRAQKAAGFLPSRTAYRIVCEATCPVLTVPNTTTR
jgi:nucleotide-binding universal stress UspA family protein